MEREDRECQHCQFGLYVIVDGDKVCDTCYALAGRRAIGYEDNDSDAWEWFWRQRENEDGRTRVVGSYQTDY